MSLCLLPLSFTQFAAAQHSVDLSGLSGQVEDYLSTVSPSRAYAVYDPSSSASPEVVVGDHHKLLDSVRYVASRRESFIEYLGPHQHSLGLSFDVLKNELGYPDGHHVKDVVQVRDVTREIYEVLDAAPRQTLTSFEVEFNTASLDIKGVIRRSFEVLSDGGFSGIVSSARSEIASLASGRYGNSPLRMELASLHVLSKYVRIEQVSCSSPQSTENLISLRRSKPKGVGDSEIVGVLRYAIDNKRVVSVKYKRQDRLIEPHLLGTFSGSGNQAVKGWHLSGHSSSLEDPAWRSYIIGKIWEVVVMPSSFRERRPGSCVQARGMIDIVSMVS